jgi:acetyl-CoA carboxylase biotin carboxyl carrier protein
MAVVNVKSEIAGNVWKIQAKPGDRIEFEGEIMILESMKMEIPVLSPKAGVIKEIRVSEGEAIAEGQLVAIIDAA